MLDKPIQFTKFITLLIALLYVFAGIGEPVQARLLQLGHYIWSDYTDLRQTLQVPACDPEVDIEAEISRLRVKAAESSASTDDVLSWFEPEPFNAEAALQSLQAVKANCRQQVQRYQQLQQQLSLPLSGFVWFEQSLAQVVVWVFAQQKILLMMLILICSAVAAVTSHHIAFRSPRHLADYRAVQLAQLSAHAWVMWSTWNYREDVLRSGGTIQQPGLMWVVLIGLALLCCVNLVVFLLAPRLSKKYLMAGHAGNGQVMKDSRGNCSMRTWLAVPLYVYMAWFASLYFVIYEHHAAGLAIYFSQLFEQADIFLKVSLFIIVGMLVKASDVGERIFAVVRSFRWSASVVVVVAVMLMAYPTAYSGASGIVILALGGVLFKELLASGVRHSLAMATTAMSGSMGVVLSPCLLVVLIAALNKEVVTSELYHWGVWVFLASVGVFAFAVMMLSLKYPDERADKAPSAQAHSAKIEAADANSILPREALATSLQAFFPYVMMLLLGVMIFYFGLDMALDEHSAPFILLVIFLCILGYEKRASRYKVSEKNKASGKKLDARWLVQWREAAGSGSVHIGALIMLMALTFAVGGVIERSEVLAMLPDQWSSPWAVMGGCVVVLVLLGMIMEPFGAIVLVSVTLAPLAYQNGLEPVHFWMTALVAFELGYLSPPVALNHLLTRQVVLEQIPSMETSATMSDDAWLRYERFLLPMGVMGLVLLMVAFGPLFFYGELVGV